MGNKLISNQINYNKKGYNKHKHFNNTRVHRHFNIKGSMKQASVTSKK